MRLKDYGRNPTKGKVYVQQPGLLRIGVDVSNAKHDACIGTKKYVQSQVRASAYRHGAFWHLLVRFIRAIEKLRIGRLSCQLFIYYIKMFLWFDPHSACIRPRPAKATNVPITKYVILYYTQRGLHRRERSAAEFSSE